MQNVYETLGRGKEQEKNQLRTTTESRHRP